MRRKEGKLKRVAGLSCILLAAVCMLLLTSCELRKGVDIGGGPEKGSDYIVLDEVPEWNGEPYCEINGNSPEFGKKEIRNAEKSVRSETALQIFTELDSLGRCGEASAVVGPDTMPTGERGSIGMIKPSGWRIAKYDFIDNGGFLFNRCHLIGWQLTGENDEVRNLVTGTRYLNTQGMLPFENRVAEYVRSTGNHVLYRATPVFRGKELVCRGVLLEAYSVEDKADGVSFSVYCYNVQPGVKIDYKTGKSKLDEKTLPGENSASDGASDSIDKKGDESDKSGAKDSAESESEPLSVPDGVTYVLNNNTMRFHRTDCKGAAEIREHNRSWFYGTREEVLEEGYVPCGMCNP